MRVFSIHPTVHTGDKYEFVLSKEDLEHIKEQGKEIEEVPIDKIASVVREELGDKRIHYLLQCADAYFSGAGYLTGPHSEE